MLQGDRRLAHARAARAEHLREEHLREPQFVTADHVFGAMSCFQAYSYIPAFGHTAFTGRHGVRYTPSIKLFSAEILILLP